MVHTMAEPDAPADRRVLTPSSRPPSMPVKPRRFLDDSRRALPDWCSSCCSGVLAPAALPALPRRSGAQGRRTGAPAGRRGEPPAARPRTRETSSASPATRSCSPGSWSACWACCSACGATRGCKKLPVHRSMAEVSELIYETCKAYMVQQGKFLLVLLGFIGAVIVVYFLLTGLELPKIADHPAVQPDRHGRQLRRGLVRHPDQHPRQLPHRVRQPRGARRGRSATSRSGPA